MATTLVTPRSTATSGDVVRIGFMGFLAQYVSESGPGRTPCAGLDLPRQAHSRTMSLRPIQLCVIELYIRVTPARSLADTTVGSATGVPFIFVIKTPNPQQSTDG